MGTDYEIRDNDKAIVDKMSVVKKKPQTLLVNRRVIDLVAGHHHISWGFQPLRSSNAVLALANGTLFISDDTADNEHDYLQTVTIKDLCETLMPDRDSSFHLTTNVCLQKAGGIYHALLPPFFVPVRLTDGDKSRLVNVKKCSDNRLALTWLFDRELQVDARIQRLTEKGFWKAQMDKDVTHPAIDQSSHLQELISSLSTVATNPTMWELFSKGLNKICE